MDNQIISALIGVAGALLGAWCGAVISRNAAAKAVKSSNENAINIMQEQEFKMACAKLRAAFAPAQAQINISKRFGENNLKSFFDEQIIVQAIAVEEFRPFASDNISYQEAWEDYQKTIYDDDPLGDAELRWWSGMVIGKGNEEILHFLDVIKQRIEKILIFANAANQTT